MNSPVLEVRNLSCERDERILFRKLNLQLFPGDIIQVVGPNGSGKTTLLRTLTTVSRSYRGEILWRGQPLAKVRLDYLNHLLYFSHLPSIKKSLTARDNLRWFSGMSSGHVQLPLDEALSRVGLYGYEDVPCYALSAGQLRRVALARLYMTPAQIWILDEPFTAIDKQGVAELEALVAQHASGGGSVILTTHQPLTVEGVKYIDLQAFQSVGDDDLDEMNSEDAMLDEALQSDVLNDGALRGAR